MKSVPFDAVQLTDRFWAPKMERHRLTTIGICLRRCRETGRIDNFARAAGKMEGGHEGRHYNDSDVYKVLEGVAYTLVQSRNPALEAEADALVETIASAQQEDGYLDSYFAINGLGNRWSDMDDHEMYCMGHLMEAAVAYFQATGKNRFLTVAIRAADHLDREFGQGGRHWVPGHAEIELALVRLFRVTGEDRYPRLARRLLDQRGRGYGFGKIWDNPDWGPAYCQDDQPVGQIEAIVGHAVRAMYLYAGMADVANELGSNGYMEALDRVWENTVEKNMYLTGGIGSSKLNEGFTEDYDLPNADAYCETCAAVGMILWNHRMNLFHGHSKYADVLETALYNGALSGVSLDGTRFFYSNPLESDGSTHRQEWFGTSCCPTQIARFLPSIGGYVYAVTEDALVVNQYVASRATISIGDVSVDVEQVTDYPWDGKVAVTVRTAGPMAHTIDFRFRIPGWCREYTVVDQAGHRTSVENGYLVFHELGDRGLDAAVTFGMPVTRVAAHERVRADAGLVALTRGPLVYCLEAADNGDDPDVTLSEDAVFVTAMEEGALGRIRRIHIMDRGRRWSAVPYHVWDNRSPGWMKVWVRNDPSRRTRLYSRS